MFLDPLWALESTADQRGTTTVALAETPVPAA